jgi:hypothetical protein
MEILEKNYIAIDSWSPLFPTLTTFLLSHVHTDHANIPKTFKQIVYASDTTQTLISHPAVRSVLTPGCWYRTHRYHLPFKVVNTMHTVDSIGFYFPSLSVLYLGDGIEPVIPHNCPLTVIYDALYEHVDRDAPSVSESCSLIQEILSKRCPVLQVVHHGILSFIAQSCRTTFRLHSSLPALVRSTAHYLDLVDTNSPYLLVGRAYTATKRVVPSSYWFIQDPLIDLFGTYDDGDKIRVFCTLHALGRDITQWYQEYPYVYFEALETNSV